MCWGMAVDMMGTSSWSGEESEMSWLPCRDEPALAAVRHRTSENRKTGLWRLRPGARLGRKAPGRHTARSQQPSQPFRKGMPSIGQTTSEKKITSRALIGASQAARRNRSPAE